MKLEKILKTSIPIVAMANVVYKVYETKIRDKYLDLERVREGL